MTPSALLRTWANVSLRPWTPSFRAELDHRSALRTLACVGAGALLGLGLSWLVHLLSGRPPQAFIGLASLWVTPVVGRVLFFVFALASLVPTTSSLKAAHGYSTLRAVVTWLLPIVLNVVVVYVAVLQLSARGAR